MGWARESVFIKWADDSMLQGEQESLQFPRTLETGMWGGPEEV